MSFVGELFSDFGVNFVVMFFFQVIKFYSSIRNIEVVDFLKFFVSLVMVFLL